MARLKVYAFSPYHVYDERVKNILMEPRVQLRFEVYIAAYSKNDAAAFAKEAHCGSPSASQIRVSQGLLGEALQEAMLLNHEGVVLITSDRGGVKPVVLMDAEQGAQAIGQIRPDGNRYTFEACRAAYAGRGSIAAGAYDAYVKTYEDGWHGTNGAAPGDDEIQRLLDVGHLKIIRSGFGDWYTAGR